MRKQNQTEVENKTKMKMIKEQKSQENKWMKKKRKTQNKKNFYKNKIKREKTSQIIHRNKQQRI